MRKITLTVHEFLSIMGSLDAERRSGGGVKADSIYDSWHAQWKTLEDKVETLAPMQRADMLFDGKVAINAISDPHLAEIIGVVEGQIKMHQELIDTKDEDADPEDLEVWQTSLEELRGLQGEAGWEG